MNCPHCGAQAQVPPGLSSYLCHYCKNSFNVGGPSAPAGYGPPPQQAPSNDAPQIVVIRQPTYTSGWSMYWTIRLAVLGLVLLVGVGGFIYKKVTGKRIAGVTDQLDDDDDDDWSGSSPLSCGGNDDISVSGVKATFTSGSAINAGGNCKVTCTNCELKAPLGIAAGGNAQVILVGGSLDASQTSIAAGGNAKVDVRGTKVTGPVAQSGNATVTGVPPAASVAAAAPAPSAHAASTAAPAHPATTPKPAASGKKK